MQQQKALNQVKNKLQVVSKDSMITQRCIAKGASIFISIGESLKLRRRAVYRNWLGWIITIVRRKINWWAVAVVVLFSISFWVSVE